MVAFSHLLIGLGNPGDEYARTRHNIGFRIVDALAEKRRCPPWKKKFKGLVTNTDALLLLKPQTFMNLSGEAALGAATFYKLKPENVIVFHDDLDLLPGQVKIKQGGGAGGHNGLKSLDAHIGKNYWRVRIGIGRPMTEQNIPVKGDAVTNYVLHPFSKADSTWLDPLIDNAAANIDLLLDGKTAAYARKLSSI